MREAKLLILNMISEGKISADDGAKLLETVYKNEDSSSESDNNQTEVSSIVVDINDSLGTEIRNRLNSIYNDVEPQLKRTVMSAIENALESASLVSNTVLESIKTNILEPEEARGENIER